MAMRGFVKLRHVGHRLPPRASLQTEHQRSGSVVTLSPGSSSGRAGSLTRSPRARANRPTCSGVFGVGPVGGASASAPLRSMSSSTCAVTASTSARVASSSSDDVVSSVAISAPLLVVLLVVGLLGLDAGTGRALGLGLLALERLRLHRF